MVLLLIASAGRLYRAVNQQLGAGAEPLLRRARIASLRYAATSAIKSNRINQILIGNQRIKLVHNSDTKLIISGVHTWFTGGFGTATNRCGVDQIAHNNHSEDDGGASRGTHTHHIYKRQLAGRWDGMGWNGMGAELKRSARRSTCIEKEAAPRRARERLFRGAAHPEPAARVTTLRFAHDATRWDATRRSRALEPHPVPLISEAADSTWAARDSPGSWRLAARTTSGRVLIGREPGAPRAAPLTSASASRSARWRSRASLLLSSRRHYLSCFSHPLLTITRTTYLPH